MPNVPKAGVLAAAAAVAVLSAACTLEIDTTGETVTKSFEVDDFNEIDLGQAFEATVVVGEATSVEFEINSELLDLVEVDVADERLTVELGGGLVSTSGPMRVTITTPELTAARIGGASDVEIRDLDASDFELDVNDASNVSAEGSVTNLKLDVSGAANVDLDATTIDTATISVDGASNVELTDASSISGTVTEASSVDVPDGGDFDIETDPSSSVD
jgi:hypothetical protein